MMVHVDVLTTRVPLKDVKEPNKIMAILLIAINIRQIKNPDEEQISENELALLSHVSQEVIGKSAALSCLTASEHVKAVRHHLESIIACLPNNVYWTDRHSVYLGCNDNTAKMLGLKSRHEIVGLTYTDMAQLCHWDEGQGESFKRDDQEVMQSGKPKLNIEEPPITDAQGRIYHFLTSRVPLYDEAKNVIGIVGISIDITERKKMEASLRNAKIAAEVADKAKTEFLENMRHDIRTPLSGIIGCAQAIKDNMRHAKRDEIEDYADNLVASSQALLCFLNEILEVIKVASVKFRY